VRYNPNLRGSATVPKTLTARRIAEAAEILRSLRHAAAFTLYPPLTLFLFATVVAVSGIAQTPVPVDQAKLEEDLSSRCAKAEATDAAEPSLVANHQSAALQIALYSEAASWSFLIDPSTSYMDRMAAASQGGSRVSLEELPRLWEAFAELEVLPSGVNPSPCKFLMSANLTPYMWSARKEKPIPGTASAQPETRSILGLRIRLPDKAVDYPLESEDRNSAPWPWQMRRALVILFDLVGQYYANPERYQAMSEVAFRWRPANFYEHQVRTMALSHGPRNKAWVESMVRLALEDGGGLGEMAVADLYVYGGDSYHLEELVHAAQIVILQQTQKEAVAGRAAFNSAQMATVKPSQPWAWKPLRTATDILAIAAWAMDQKVAAWNRYYLFASPLCQIIDEPPFKPNPSLNPESPEVTEALDKFEAWFSLQRPRLEREAAKESPHLTSLAAELHRHIGLGADRGRTSRQE
jgi:hypothetical protein